jgi:hypothetical protein
MSRKKTTKEQAQSMETKTYMDCVEDVVAEERKDRKETCIQNNQGAPSDGRTVIVRGPYGEILLNSINPNDTLEQMAKIAVKEYYKRQKEQNEVDYIS